MRKTINFKVSGEEWKKAIDEAFKKLNKKAKIDGFRPGKAPRDVFEKKYGKQEILLEATDTLMQQRYKDIIEKDKIIPIIEPKIEIVKSDEEGLEVNFNIITDPEVKLGEYKKLGVKKDKVEVSQDEIDHQIHHMIEHYAELVEKDGKVENGDIAIIDFEGFMGGKPFEGGKAENYSLEIGSHSFIPGFEEGIVGMSKDEEKDIELTFPKDYHAEDLKGKKVTFKVKVNDIKNRVLPELDKDFFEDLGIDGVTNKEELEKMVKEEIAEQKEHHADNVFIDALLEAASKNMEIELEDELVDREINNMYKQFVDRLAMQGINEEIYFEYAKTTEEDVKKEMHDEALNRIKYRYLLEAVIKEEKIKVTEKDVDKEAEKIASQYGITTEELFKEIDRDMLKYDLEMRKAIDVLKENNK